jgi:tRNA-specific 2-thiouridylase
VESQISFLHRSIRSKYWIKAVRKKNSVFNRISTDGTRGGEGVVVGMSGGVDSTAAAIILSGMGLNVVGATLRFPRISPSHNSAPPSNGGDVECAAGICSALGIPHVVEDVRELFIRKIVKRFTRDYRNGKTPNPCVLCNQMVKFPLLASIADRIDCRYIATGHYAGLVEGSNGRRFLARSQKGKDQSYFLYRVPVKLLNRTLLPLDEISKEEAKNCVDSKGLGEFIAEESQDTCFLSGDVGGFLADRLGYQQGDIVDEKGNVMGNHQGIHFYTVGQRRGIGIPASEPLYVKNIHSSKNRIVIAKGGSLYSDMVVFGNLKMRFRRPSGPLVAKLRYRHDGAKVESIDKQGKMMRVVFKKPQRAITAGQSLVLYNEEGVLVGGGIIE